MRRLAIPIMLATVALTAAVASGELTQNGNLPLAFNGRITPKKLPRDEAGPGHGPGQRVGQHRRTRTGRPSCARSRSPSTATGSLDPRPADLRRRASSSRRPREGARELPRGAGRPRRVPRDRRTQRRDPVPVVGDRRSPSTRAKAASPALLLHIYADRPGGGDLRPRLPHPQARRGRIRDGLHRPHPEDRGRLGYVTSIDLVFGRRYTYHGEQRSFLSARCAAPEGYPGAVFTLAKGSFAFANGQRISTSLARNCWVR